MATTDARSGFRLPWSSEQRSPDDDEGEEREADVDSDAPDGRASGDRPASRAGASAPQRSTPAVTAPTSARRPSKFLADLTRAMQVAAESAREETVTRLQTDAKTWIEDIHARSADGATDLRRRADDEVAAIREWSKAEMARIREETDRRIAARKQRLEIEIDEHGARIERQVGAVQRRVTEFEAEMAAFFERLLAEDDPGRFASLAENLPEPPPFDEIAAEVDRVDDAPAAKAPTPDVGTDAAMTAGPADAVTADTDEEADARVDESRAADTAAPPDFAAAEAEALAGVDDGDQPDVPELGDDEISARLANLVPGDAPTERSAPRQTSVVVTGLVSVASIASFKRNVARLSGVQSVAVSSGPEGEFVFSVTHDGSTDLPAAIPDLPGFGARVTGTSDDVIEVTARDPDPEP